MFPCKCLVRKGDSGDMGCDEGRDACTFFSIISSCVARLNHFDVHEEVKYVIKIDDLAKS